MILMNDFKREYDELKEITIINVDKFLSSGVYILGKYVAYFEKKFADYVGVKYCIGVGNGMEALQISLIALGIGKGDEVITVANSAVATSLSIYHVGATPVFVDIDDYYHINAEEIEKKITSKTKAIIPVHLFGQIADIEKLIKVSRKYKLKIIEDACQAHGALYKNKKAGSFGHLGTFSFYPTKNLGTYGDGGAITTNSKNLYEKCKALRNYGQKKRYQHMLKGINSRLDEIHAMFLSIKLNKLDQSVIKRNQLAKLYFKNLKNVPQIILPKLREHCLHSFHLFVIQAQRRNQLQQFLLKNDIQSLVHYPIPIHKQKSFLEYKTVILENTENFSKKIISLPIHPYLSEREIITVCRAIKQFYRVHN